MSDMTKPKLLKNSPFVDFRGQFIRIFDKQSEFFVNSDLQQVNLSKNPARRTLRGMHFQVSGPPEHKFITIISGTVHLVVSNAHIASHKSEVKNYYFVLSDEVSETLFVPSGLATGWISLSENVTLSYLMTSRFQDCKYAGFRFDDPFSNIFWPSTPEVISEKDISWPFLS